MIPVKLNIRNFLSYRENVPTLDFTGLHVACLCGDNGHGKSALLDAITWCLWGTARGSVQDELVSFGADEARVELDFSARDGHFRAIRSRRRGGGRRRQGATDLQLLALGDGGEISQVVSGNSVRETQARVRQLVGMDYDTFVNSALLLQGRSDEFTNKTPTERKTVLASVLGLEAYDRYQSRSREELADKRGELDRLTGSLARLEADLATLGNPEQALEEALRRLAAVEERLDREGKETEELRVKVNRFQGLSVEMAECQRRRTLLEGDLNRVQASLEGLETRVNSLRALVARTDEIRAGQVRLEETKGRLTALESARLEFDGLQHERASLTNAIQVESMRLEAEVNQLQRKIADDLHPLADSRPALEAELEEGRRRLGELAHSQLDVAEMRSNLQSISEKVGEAQSLASRYQAEGEQLGEKLRLLRASDPEQTVCPLCLTPLANDGCQRLIESYELEIQDKRELYRSNRSHLQALEKHQTELEADLKGRERSLLQEVLRLQEGVARAEARLDAAKVAGSTLEQAKAEIATLRDTIAREDFASDSRRRLSLLEKEISGLGYDQETHSQVLQAVRTLEPVTQLVAQLESASAQLPLEEEAHRHNIELRERMTAELAAITRQVSEAEALIAGMPEMEVTLKQKLEVLAALDSERQEALAERGMLQGRVDRKQELAREVAQTRERLEETREALGIYQELTAAFGRQGIQAMLIETVVPQLEEESNTLLGRMTDNRMHVKLETQRERRSGSGEPIETLEINVSDELGTRSYEMYSGGEAFRVNLALRIALSRVLCQRTGAPLPTLFIDEGFGTQDASGRERILDVIGAIGDDFDKIIVITHLDELKDMFPVRIEVQKDANGSTFWLS